MKINYLVLNVFVGLLVSISTFAQGNIGADYLSLGELKMAEDYFQLRIRQMPADSYYYLGEIAFAKGDMAAAKTNYEQGLAGNPESVLNAIGVLKLGLKENPKVVGEELNAIQKKNKKDADIILAIAKAYLDNGMKAEAMAKLEDARKANKKSPAVYIFEGDMLFKDGKPGEAGMQYDQAINFDPNSAIANIKGALVYETINPSASVELLKKAIAINPEYKIAYRYLGRIYADTGFFPEAIEAYETFFDGGAYNSVKDIISYAGAEYHEKDYEAVKKLVSATLATEPNNFVLNRLLMYAYAELKEYDLALTVANKFFALPRDKNVNFIAQDHMTYGLLLGEAKKPTEAIAEYLKALALDTTKIALNKEIAALYSEEGLDVEAANLYKKYIALLGAESETNDYYQLGRYYSFAASTALKSEDAAEKAKGVEYLKDADAAFATVTERKPDSYLGYYQRAQMASLLDPELTQGLAKPHFEAALKAILAKEEPNAKVLIEIYSYLSYFYYLQYEKSPNDADKANVKLYAEKLLEVDPGNSNGTQLYDFAKDAK